MTIDQFIRKWSPSDIGAINAFQEDLFSVCGEGAKEFQKVAIQVLTYPEGASLKIITKEEQNHILYYPTGKDPNDVGLIYATSRAVGIEERDWLWVLQGLASYYIKSKE